MNPLIAFAVAIAAVPFIIYGIDQALVQRNSWPPKSDPHHNAHWLTMANVALAIPLIGLVAALRVPGWRLAAWSAAGLAGALGVTSALLPNAASSLEVAGGVASTAWGIAVILIRLEAAGRVSATSD